MQYVGFELRLNTAVYLIYGLSHECETAIWKIKFTSGVIYQYENAYISLLFLPAGHLNPLKYN